MTAPDYKADAGAKRKRETKLERITKALTAICGDHLALEAATLAINAYPEPSEKLEKDRPKTADDACVLCAKRGEFADLVEFISGAGDVPPRVAALARALVDQHVVTEAVADGRPLR